MPAIAESASTATTATTMEFLSISERAKTLLFLHRQDISRHTDKIFCVLMMVQWILGIAAAVWITPHTWIGAQYLVHVHLLAAIFLGGLIVSLPIAFTLWMPGRAVTRHTVAVGQMLFGALLIHLTGGRIETHFHVFGSLAFLHIYRDWRVLITASTVVVLDHVIRSVWDPQSIYGVVLAGEWRWLEHAGWVVFIDIFLIAACIRGVREMRIIANRQSEAEAMHAKIEAIVVERTAQLETACSKAEEAGRAKSDFLANMSHEIRTPMTAILGFADLLATEVEREQSPCLHQEYVQIIRRNGEHLLDIINDILDISKIEAGKMEVEHVPMQPAQIVHDVLSLMSVRAKAKSLRLEAIFETDIPETIQSDPVRLRQILMNLVGNAIKFTELGSVRLIGRYEREESSLHFDVTDTGIGMTPKQLSRMFQAFVQADTSTTRKFGGSGLGLRISKRLAEMLGGDILVTSQFGKGSTFTATIPTGTLDGVPLIHRDDVYKVVMESRVKPLSAVLVPKAGAVCKLNGMRILLAEDGTDNQRLISHVLRKAGAHVRIVENGRLAVESLTVDGTLDGELLDPPPVDLLLSDMQMPEMDGYAATRLLRAKGCSLPIVALTANAMAGDADKCIQAGCDEYESKPIDKDKLIATCLKSRFAKLRSEPVLIG